MVSVWEGAALIGAGLAAGTINTIVGSGGLIAFPVLLTFGYSPLVANTTQTLGLLPGSLSGAIGYRRELRGQMGRTLRLGIASLLGGVTGALLLFALPAAAFRAIVPILIALAVLLIIFQPRLTHRLNTRQSGPELPGWLKPLALYACGIYGGYFGAAQGVLLIA
ncbi:MAG: sulfite exporter TauE/SafE family protein, partial [Candidatus Dormibacteraceae bacterium]